MTAASASLEERVRPLLQLLFQAPGDLEAWWPFMAALGRAISSDVRAFMIVEQSEPVPLTVVFGEGTQRAAPGTIESSSALRSRFRDLPAGAVFEIPASTRRRPTAVFDALLGAEGMQPGPILGATLGHNATSGGVFVVLSKNAGWRPTAADRALFEYIAPFFPLATQLHRRLLGGSAITAILDYLALGVILLDGRGYLSYANRSGAEILGVAPGLSDPSIDRDPRTDALYRTVPREAAGKSRYRHPVDGRPLQILSTPLAWPNPHGDPARRFALALFIGDPTRNTGDPIDSLADLYGLTPSEAKLAWLLVGGRSRSEAAEQLGITGETARTVLKRVLGKTETRSQTDLVRLLLSGPGQLRSDEAKRPSPEAGTPGKPRRRRGPGRK